MRGAESVAATRRLMITENFRVQKPAVALRFNLKIWASCFQQFVAF
jgi:hypothetical protein